MDFCDRTRTKMWLIWFLVLQASIGISLSCPAKCRCSLDERGRRKIQCERGNMKDPIPVSQMGSDTEVLYIFAPESRQNSLSLGRIFKNLRKLEEIHITWSQIPALGDHTFWGLHHLRVLNLSHNSIESLKNTNFKGVESIRHLDLSFNKVESIPSAVFYGIQHLKSLTVANNRIPELTPRVFFGLLRLENLDLSYNPLGDLLPERFTDIPNLKKFSCAGCGLMAISNSLLEKLSNLHHLNLRDNRLTQMPSEIGILRNLHTLHIQGNHISFLEGNILAESSLKKLCISHNRIIRIEEGAFANTSLSHLDMSYNRLSNLVPKALDDVLNQLTNFQLSGNSLHIDELKSLLPKASKLHHIGLGDMGLTLLPPNLLRHSKHLHHLNVSANYLQRIPLQILKSTPQLQILDLSLNSFRGLEEKFVAYLTDVRELRVLRLEGNPWLCDKCHVGPMLGWLQAAPDQESGCHDPRVWTCLKCIGPKGFSGTILSLLPPGDLPSCAFTTPPKPTWVGPTLTNFIDQRNNVVPLSDEPRLPHGPLTLQEEEWSFNKFLEEQFLLVIIIGCIVIFFLTMVIVAAVVAYNRHSAFYYTYENDPNKKRVKGKESKNNNSPKTNGQTNEKGSPTIATIDEVTNIAGSHEVLDPKPDIQLECEPLTRMDPIEGSPEPIPLLECEPKPGSN